MNESNTRPETAQKQVPELLSNHFSFPEDYARTTPIERAIRDQLEETLKLVRRYCPTELDSAILKVLERAATREYPFKIHEGQE